MNQLELETDHLSLERPKRRAGLKSLVTLSQVSNDLAAKKSVQVKSAALRPTSSLRPEKSLHRITLKRGRRMVNKRLEVKI